MSVYMTNYNYLFGGTMTIVGIILAAFFHIPHFYAFFSLGLFIVFLELYKSIVHRRFFARWSPWKFVVFWVLLLLASIAIDILGMRLGYWHYPFYMRFYDQSIKYLFEWCVSLMYVTLGFFIGTAIFKKHHVHPFVAGLLSLVAVVIPLGFITEYFNHMVSSWVILSMPITSYSVDGYFLVFQTIGYWIIALVPWLIYELVDFLKN